MELGGVINQHSIKQLSKRKGKNRLEIDHLERSRRVKKKNDMRNLMTFHHNGFPKMAILCF
jgi:hypothetical protein